MSTDAERAKVAGYPKGAVVVQGTSAVITTTTAVPIIAAPAAGVSTYITKLHVCNKTAGETPVLTFQDDTGTPIVFMYVAPGDPAVAGGGEKTYDFGPAGLKVTAAKSFDAEATTTTGDCYATAFGYQL